MLCGKGVLQLQEAGFFVEAGGVACECAVGADYPVAGDDDGDGISGDCIADGLGGHLLQTVQAGVVAG